ncbi:MAG: hypothetical protein GY841_06555 [FCB group bacterium]|nr:hypothetical protein [FCB group bacterium]
MSPKQNIALILIVICSTTIIGCSKSTPDGHFTGDLLIQGNGQDAMGSIQHAAQYYRIDISQENSEYYFHVFPDSSLVRLFVLEKSGYYEFDISGYNIFRNDPFQELSDLILSNKRGSDSTEIINGYNCDRKLVIKDDQTIATYWQSQKFNFPIKIIFHEDDKTVTINNIKEIEVKDELFQIPEGYTLLTP